MANRLRTSRIVATLAATAWLAGCGFKGPLYRPGAAGSPQQSKPPVITAPYSFDAASGVRITPALPTLPAAANQQ